MAGEACSGGRRVGLDGVALVEESLLVELAEQPPERLDVLVVVGDVGVLHVDPVAHLVAQVGPFAGVHHHVLAALAVVVLDADGFADVFLRDAELLLHAELHGQSVCVPSGLAVDLVALHRLEAAEGVLDAACQHMVYARVSVGRRGAFVEDERGTAFPLGDAPVEDVLCVPLLEHLFACFAQVELIAFCEFLAHKVVCCFF